MHGKIQKKNGSVNDRWRSEGQREQLTDNVCLLKWQTALVMNREKYNYIKRDARFWLQFLGNNYPPSEEEFCINIHV